MFLAANVLEATLSPNGIIMQKRTGTHSILYTFLHAAAARRRQNTTGLRSNNNVDIPAASIDWRSLARIQFV